MPKAVVHVDLDGASAIYEANGVSYNYEVDSLFESGLRNLLPLLDRFGIKATLFTIAEDLRDGRKHELLTEAVRQGHEIAAHTITHPRLRTLPRERKRVEIAGSREQLEAELGVEVKGFRAPGYQIDRESLEIMADCGYFWDSSVFPNKKFAERLQVPTIPSEPHCPIHDCGLLELPLPDYGFRPFPFHPCYSLILGHRYFLSGLRRHRRTRMPLVFLFHLTDTADPLPPDRLPGWRLKLMTLSHLTAERKIERCSRMLHEVQECYSLTTTDALIEDRCSHLSEYRDVDTSH